MEPIRQAVLLCGGLGTRMRPLTDTLPKPMVPVNGKPFLEILIEQIREQGVTQVLLLTGYLGDPIRAHFGDGARFGVEARYSHGPVEWDTGRRLWEARAQLDPRFLLLYSDNFTPFNLDSLLSHHAAARSVVSLTLQPKATGNIRLGPGGEIECYDPSRKASGLDYVEIGYMLVERDPMFACYEQPDISFSAILQRLAEQGTLSGKVGRDPYYSISDPVRWKLAERYLEPKRILLMDRDGTINLRPPPGEYVTNWSEFRWADDAVAAMRNLAEAGFRFIVLTNQAGIARGMVSREAVDTINHLMVRELQHQGIEVLDVFLCPHHWDNGCGCRKPAPGLFFRASKEHLVRLDRTMYAGDDPRDCLAAHNAGCLSVLVGSELNTGLNHGVHPAFSAASLTEAVPWILDRFKAWEA